MQHQMNHPVWRQVLCEFVLLCRRFDVHDRKLVAGEFEECGLTHFIRGLDVDVPERRVNLKFGRNDKTLGFNVRGGKEYGLGIYISKYAMIYSIANLVAALKYVISIEEINLEE